MTSDRERIILSVLETNTLAIIGLEKNTGKTETLNFIIKNIGDSKTLGLTSIGTDGEEKDIVFGTLKPSVYVSSGTVYTTTEAFFRRRLILSEIMHVSKQSTPTGRLIIAKACENGKVILSGPPSANWMKQVVSQLHEFAHLVIIDGALSRFSQANPTIADGIILATGAAYSLDKHEITKYTSYVYKLCKLPEIDPESAGILSQSDVICIYDGVQWQKTSVKSALDIHRLKELLSLENNVNNIKSVFIPGALTDNALRYFHDKEIIVRDFTKIFVKYENYVRYKPKIRLLEKSKIIGITVNPFSPTGYTLNSKEIIRELKNFIPDLPIIDVRM